MFKISFSLLYVLTEQQEDEDRCPGSMFGSKIMDPVTVVCLQRCLGDTAPASWS